MGRLGYRPVHCFPGPHHGAASAAPAWRSPPLADHPCVQESFNVTTRFRIGLSGVELTLSNVK